MTEKKPFPVFWFLFWLVVFWPIALYLLAPEFTLVCLAIIIGLVISLMLLSGLGLVG